jgi:hypothetical protein
MGYENNSGTLAGPYISSATRDSFYTSSTGYGGAPAKLIYTISGLSTARTYNVTLFASRIGASGEVRSALYTIGMNNAVLDAAENSTKVATISNITPINGQIVITQEKSSSNTNTNGFAYLGVIAISSQPASEAAAMTGLTVNAGSAQTITAPASSVTLFGSATAAPGRIVTSYKWSEVTSRGATIVAPNTAATAVSNLLPGVYTFMLTATDNVGSVGTSSVKVTVYSGSTETPAPITTVTPTPTQTPAQTPSTPTTPVTPVSTTSTNKYLIDIGHPDYQTTASGWNNIYTGHDSSISLVDSTGAASGLSLSVSPTPPASFGNTSGTTAGPYPASATQDSFFTSTNGYYGSPNKFTYTISGVSAARTYIVTLYASRMGAGGDMRTTLYSVNGKTAVLNAAENVSNTVTISGVTPVNGQIVITQEKDSSNANSNGFSYLGALEITAQTVGLANTSQLASVVNAFAPSNTTSAENTVGKGALTLTRTMHFGMSGSDVHELQKYLNAHGFAVAAAGEGSLGTETTNFGQGTKQALIRFQNAHAAEILTPAGLTEGSGILGALTRQYINTHP